jgi:hypothetical protein
LPPVGVAVGKLDLYCPLPGVATLLPLIQGSALDLVVRSGTPSRVALLGLHRLWFL